MIRSMTGFGRAEVSGATIVVSVEARSVNHRHLDVAVRLPRTLASLEMDARRLVQSRLERGRIEVTVQVSPAAGQSAQQIRLDAPLARQYIEQARALGASVGIPGDVTLEWVLQQPGVVRTEDAETPDPAATWRIVAEALSEALEELVRRRTAEGEALAAELRSLHGSLQATVEQIAARMPAAAARRTERLRERMRALLGEGVIDENRILTEVAMWADRTDIAEELTRVRAHLEQAALVLGKGGPVGRLLDFLIQELNREINTVASKADDLDLSQAAIAAKSILEKMREQVQNLE
jgi:uncharacterized protein (TIGR00255 family)